MQLQQNLPDLRARGIGLVAVSYDPPATLKAFADARGITFPLLSDAGSATIKRYNILNTEATGRAVGVPYPGTFVLNAKGVVISRSFEERYQERATASSLVAQAQISGVTARKTETPHLTLSTSTSDERVAPGTRFSLLVDVAPKPKMHVYAPDKTQQYIAVSLTLEADEAFKVHPAKFPPAEKYFFEPLKETQLVYSKPFRIAQDVTIALTPAMRKRAGAEAASLSIKGTLRYQACDDKVCYMPQNLPVEWTIGLRPLG